MGGRSSTGSGPRARPFVREPALDFAGTPREQRKAMVADPSGNAIEFKTYTDPGAALGG